jgi:ABC-type branched-subunit amino acid transport system substrate-binding protein
MIAAGAAACGRAATPGVSEDEVVLGMTAPLTGPAAAWGRVALGARAWAEEVNAGGGVHGRRIRLLVRDDGYSPGRALAQLQALRGSVLAVLGPVGTTVLQATRRPLADAGVPLVCPLGNPRVFSDRGALETARVFSVYADYRGEGELLGTHAVTLVGARRVAVFYQNDDFGKEGLFGTRRGVETSGGSLVAAVPYDTQERELGLHARRLRDSRAQALVLYATASHAGRLVKELARLGHRPSLLASFALSDRHVMFGLVGELWAGTRFHARGAVRGEEAADRVLARLLAREPRLRGSEGSALDGAVAMMVAVEALRRAGRDLDRASFVAALEGLRDFTPEGLGAPISFAPGRHHGLNAVRLMRAGRRPEDAPVELVPWQHMPALF